MRWPYSAGSKQVFSPGSYKTEPGKKLQPVFEPFFDGSTTVLRKVATKDLQSEIDSYEKYTDLSYMLHCLSVGDNSVLTKSQPLYGDFTVMPNSPADAVNYLRAVQSEFDSLSASERANFGNDWRVWANSLFGAASSGASKKSIPDDSTSTVKDGDDNGSKS